MLPSVTRQVGIDWKCSYKLQVLDKVGAVQFLKIKDTFALYSVFYLFANFNRTIAILFCGATECQKRKLQHLISSVPF